MHARPRRDFGNPVAVHPQPDDLVMGLWAGAQDTLPELAALGDLAGAGLGRVEKRLGRRLVQRPLTRLSARPCFW